MAKIEEGVKALIEEVNLGYVSTATKDGVPNVAPKGSIRLMDEETLLFADLFPGKTSENLSENPNISVAFVKPDTFEGYQIKGKAQVMTSGKIYEKTVEAIKNAPMDLPKPHAAVVIKVEKVYNLAPGPEAGKRV